MPSIAGSFADIARRVTELERRLASQSRVGTITEVDAASGMARVELQDGMTTGWIPWEESGAGAMRTHVPPSVGQQVRLMSESGDLADASIQGSLNSDSNGRPSSAGDTYVLLEVGVAKIAVTGGGDEMLLQVGGSTIRLSDAGVDIEGARVDLN